MNNKILPSFVDIIDILNPTGFFDTIYDRNESVLKEKSQKEIVNLYGLFQKLDFIGGDSISNFAEGATRMAEVGIGILPYTKKLFEKYGIPTNGILIQTVEGTTTFKDIQRLEIDRKKMADYIHEKALDKYFDIKKVELSHQSTKIKLGTATFERKQ